MSLPAECFFDDLEYVYDDFEPFLRLWDDELENASDPFSRRLHLAWLVLLHVYDGKIPETFPVPIPRTGSPRFRMPMDWLFSPPMQSCSKIPTIAGRTSQKPQVFYRLMN